MKQKLKVLRSKVIYGPVKKLFSAFGYAVVNKTLLEQAEQFDQQISMSSPNFEDEQLFLKPRETELNFDHLVSFLTSEGLGGVSIDTGPLVDVKLCFLEDARREVLLALSKYCVEEGVELRYNAGGRVNKAKSIVSVLSDLKQIKSVSMKIISHRSDESFSFRTEFWAIEADFYTTSSANMVAKKLWRQTAEDNEIFNTAGIKDYSTILRHPHANEVNFDIDLVFTWVNSDDPDWQELYAEHGPELEVGTDATSISRFFSRDELMYALRSWDTYAPFINKVYIVSNCAPPPWLDLDNDRVSWVPHEDILPKSALPTFSSHAIETSLHKIKGLSNYFIYSNDDFLLTRRATPSDFYHPNGIAKIRLEPYGMVNGSPDENHPDYLNGARNANALIENTLGRSTTQLVTHSPQPMRVDVMENLSEMFKDELNNTAHNKFRTVDDIPLTGYLYAHYAIVTGKAISDDVTRTTLIQQNHPFKKKFNALIKNHEQYNKLPLSICINDGANSHLNESWNKSVSAFLGEYFPSESTFERT